MNPITGGIYVHIPFCRKKCLYCDFFSGGFKPELSKDYVSSILNELKLRIKEVNFKVDTLYIGGGTPSLLEDINFRFLSQGIKNLLAKEEDWREFTIEVNPEDVTFEKCMTWKEAGVNRVSMGIQSFNENELKKIGRFNKIEVIDAAIGNIKNVFDNFSLDLIFGLPDQTDESWRQTLLKTLNNNPPHLSCYLLMLEEGTPLRKLYELDKITLPPESEIEKMWNSLLELTESSDLRQYEISNFAKPGFESIHNSSYWDRKPYIGLGVAAHSYDGINKRRWNKKRLKDYINYYNLKSNIDSEKKSIDNSLSNHFDNRNENELYEIEILDKEALRLEYLLTGLRKDEGINLIDYRIKFGEKEIKELMINAKKLLKEDKIIIKDNNLSIKRDQRIIGDSIILELS